MLPQYVGSSRAVGHFVNGLLRARISTRRPSLNVSIAEYVAASIMRPIGKRHLPARGAARPYRQGKRPLSAAPAPSIAAVSSAAPLSAA
jgi:hypothetical protein